MGRSFPSARVSVMDSVLHQTGLLLSKRKKSWNTDEEWPENDKSPEWHAGDVSGSEGRKPSTAFWMQLWFRLLGARVGGSPESQRQGALSAEAS